ncbi:hypothetical protein OESDEN_23951 [Oesophagostomum dentatum]|uniref:Uncharacterized protein n=1 Tax=Oesophagostomum dentatum TaxID=61180 RepID=A0A0B1RUS0_OESDE|nr:hypothetical protein OESDEN_23951 [Oesophagostomum dentatum]
MIELARKDNLTMYESLKRCKAEYEALKKETVNDPDLVKKITAQLQEIHTAMGQSSRTYELFEKATSKVSKHGKQGESS